VIERPAGTSILVSPPCDGPAEDPRRLRAHPISAETPIGRVLVILRSERDLSDDYPIIVGVRRPMSESPPPIFRRRIAPKKERLRTHAMYPELRSISSIAGWHCRTGGEAKVRIQAGEVLVHESVNRNPPPADELHNRRTRSTGTAKWESSEVTDDLEMG